MCVCRGGAALTRAGTCRMRDGGLISRVKRTRTLPPTLWAAWHVWVAALVVFGFVGSAHAEPGMRLPDFPGLLEEIESGQKGIEAAKRLNQDGNNGKQGKNDYRGGSDQAPATNMVTLFNKILYGQGKDFDKWYSPHLRDIQYPTLARLFVASHRGQSGVADMWPGFFCLECRNGLGGKKTACPICQPPFGCAGQEWYDKDLRWECCGTLGEGTRAYRDLVLDTNFKICCVEEKFKNASTEEISCNRPDGTGWAGLFEYYYPTTVMGWENDRTTTMIASKAEVQSCLAKTRPLMEQKGVNWVDQAIKRNLDQVEKLQSDGAGGGSVPAPGGDSGAAGLRSKIQEDIRDVRPKDRDLQFADSLQGAGLTMRVNFPAMDGGFRRQLALQFCMHEDQFMKIMDQREDPLQRPYGSLETIPIWANYCEQGATLMTNPDESLKLGNPDGTATNLGRGTKKWKEDPLFCQRINAKDNPFLKEFFGEVLAKSGGAASGFNALNPGEHGFTCREGGKLNGSLAPVTMYRHAAVERRTAIGDLALGFLVAGGIYYPTMADMTSPTDMTSKDKKSFYKRFEPQPYSKQFGMFSGMPFKGVGMNERNYGCRPVQGEDYSAAGANNRSDRLYISDVTHQDVFTQEIINNPGGKEFNRYVQDWAEPSAQNKITHRGLDENSSNYAAAFRIFATCPKGFVRWRHNDPLTNDLTVSPVCGEENLGGAHSPIGGR